MTQFKLIAKLAAESLGGVIRRELTFESILEPPLNNYRLIVYPTTAEEYDPLEVGDIFTFTLTPVV